MSADATAADAVAIAQLGAAGADLSAPHTILHHIYMPNREAADSIADELRQRGCHIEMRLVADIVNWLVLHLSPSGRGRIALARSGKGETA
jgi:hypothetical protein